MHTLGYNYIMQGIRTLSRPEWSLVGMLVNNTRWVQDASEHCGLGISILQTCCQIVKDL